MFSTSLIAFRTSLQGGLHTSCVFYALLQDGSAEAKAALSMAEEALAKMQELASNTEHAVHDMEQLRGKWMHMEQRLEDMWQVQVCSCDVCRDQAQSVNTVQLCISC